MKQYLLAALFGAFACTAFAQDTDVSPIDAWQADPTLVFDAADIDLALFQFRARPIIVFADTPFDPRFEEQMEYLTARADELVIRDVIVIVDTDPSAETAVREALRPRGFSLVLMDKDGRVHLRKPNPWDVREITRSIDKMPLRQQELGR